MKVTPNFVDNKQHQQNIIIELIGVLLAFVVSYALSSFFNVSDHFYEWAQQYEKTSDIDELIFALLGFLLALMWFAKRRINESRKLILYNHSLLQRLLQIQEDERKSIAQHLHDDLGQYLNAIKAHTSLLIDDANNDAALFAAQRISSSADHAYNTTRRMMHSLRPVALDELGLSAAIEHMIDTWKVNANSSLNSHEKIDVNTQKNTEYRLEITGDIDGLPENTNIAIFRIVQEALTNIAKHAQATLIQVVIKNADTILNITVQDNGIGFDVNQKTTDNHKQACYGLLGIAERVEALAGTLHIVSIPAQGTAIAVEIKQLTLNK
ncbi:MULTISPECIES: sensor histidine kinase [Methylotenera]|uniref:sensor histidine kinase n=1 Tax=Methylotenera TaxID=359407 RepID=UPI00036DE447|nr:MULTISPECIES: sensor histidine kinase [Methylotenera]